MNQIITHVHLANLKYAVLFIVISMLCQCSSPEQTTTEEYEYQKELSAKLYKIRNEDSLLVILQQFIKDKDDVGQMMCYKHLGSIQRASARFSDAISSHKQNLAIAQKLNDTIQIVEAMNNLGTNFRRIAAHTEASQYHYGALHYAESWSELTTPTGSKNRSISLNGIGNISLTLGYYNHAEKIFREALKIETALQRHIGMAINYANLGAVFEKRDQNDSAYIYYQKSLEQNKIAKSDMGIGLCMIHLGELFEKDQKYDLAKIKYEEAYELMDQISNKWHWLVSSLALARIHLITEDIASFKNYINLAERTAVEIESIEHLSEVYLLKHKYNLKQGDLQLALNNYKQYHALQDSVQGIEKASRHVEIHLEYAQNKSLLQLQKMEAENKIKQQEKQYFVYISWLAVIVSFIITAVLYYGYRQRTRTNKILKRIESTRTHFFTNITHEFRTPLTVIQGLNRQMDENKNLTDKEIKAFREAIERQSNKLLNLVNQVLDLAKLKRGSDTPKWKRGDIVAYLQMTAETYRLYAKEKDLKLLFYSDTSKREMDFVPSYIDKIISNLLSNAIKHTDAGGKIVFAVSQGKRADTLIIRISDTGEGIPEEDLVHIFDSFFQSSQSKNTSGSGIGLAFTKLMVGKMKGKIKVESQLGQGSIFTIKLPLKNKQATNITSLKKDEIPIVVIPIKGDEITHDEEHLETLGEEDKASNLHPIVLIVEDNKDITLYLKSLLSTRYKVITAWNGQEGLEKAEKYIPDLMITDLMMPVKDGYELAREMKQSSLLNHIPIIVITAKNSDEDRVKGLQYGVDAYISKPFQHEELLIRIENIFASRHILKEKYMSAITRSDSSTKINNDANLKFLQTITNFIHSEIKNPELNSTYLASKMALSISQLNRKINGITGYSTISYVLKLKLNKAKKMLGDESISVTDVSDACGFYDASYFSRAFKKEFGVSPSQYQKMPSSL